MVTITLTQEDAEWFLNPDDNWVGRHERLCEAIRHALDEPKIINNKRVEMPRCQAMTKKGTQCLNSAWIESDYCGIHDWLDEELDAAAK